MSHSTTYFSEDFVLAAGSVLFRHHPSHDPASSNGSDGLQVCILQYEESTDTTSSAPTTTSAPTVRYVLPKGRKDQLESLPAAALRETFEETGYHCVHLPCLLPTRAPLPGANTQDIVRVVDGVREEPFAVTVKAVKKKIYREGSEQRETAEGVKFIFWYLLRVRDRGVSEPEQGAQIAYENFKACFVDPDEAVNLLARLDDKDVVRKAVALVQNSSIALAALRG
ncbi:hypothetical protein AX16_008812 [Volvariella volvacea WC 439]|nr:hypothetical protein AX16_008812 [Volvariella volvacea WC 439]